MDAARIIDEAWDARDTLNPSTKGPVREAVEHALDALDSGTARVAEKHNGEWVVHQWLKKAARYERGRRRTRKRAVVGQGRFEIPGVG
jgi:tetrahydrodipicolinate N-succinyltransferase